MHQKLWISLFFMLSATREELAAFDDIVVIPEAIRVFGTINHVTTPNSRPASPMQSMMNEPDNIEHHDDLLVVRITEATRVFDMTNNTIPSGIVLHVRHEDAPDARPDAPIQPLFDDLPNDTYPFFDAIVTEQVNGVVIPRGKTACSCLKLCIGVLSLLFVFLGIYIAIATIIHGPTEDTSHSGSQSND